jgi:hypothetical protein
MKLAFWQGAIHMVALRDRVLMTVEEYFAWEETQLEKHEYWDGEVVPWNGGTIEMAGTTRSHNRVAMNFFKQLDSNSKFGWLATKVAPTQTKPAVAG